MPVVKEEDEKEPFHHSTSILNWWSSFEQRSLELSLEYRYMFVTDITNCFGAINPQSIDWALSRNITRYMSAFQQGRNIGIPQGSELFCMVAELVLGYSDLLLHEKLEPHIVKVRCKVLPSLHAYEEQEVMGTIVENIRAMAAIGVQIAIENVGAAHYALKVLSRPHSGYEQIWLQNITYQHDRILGGSPYNVSICRFVAGESQEIWNNNWLKPEFTAGLPMDTVCDPEKLKDLTPVINFKEHRTYYE